MDEKIEKLKSAYLATQPPVSILENGFNNVLLRIERSKTPIYFSKAFIFAVLLLFVAAGAGLTYAAMPNTPLYTVRQAVQSSISKIATFTPKEVKESVQKFVAVKKSKPTPTHTPTTTKTQNEHSNSQSEIH